MLQFETGAITGTGSDIDVNLGYKPVYVKVVNRTVPAMLEFFDGMGDDNGIQYNQIADDGATSTNNFESVASDGITIIDTSSISDPGGDPDGPVEVQGTVGFQIPAAFQSANDELYYVAGRD